MEPLMQPSLELLAQSLCGQFIKQISQQWGLKMIVKEGKKYVVKSEDGSKTLGTYHTRSEAKKRLMQIEYFKHQKKK